MYIRQGTQGDLKLPKHKSKGKKIQENASKDFDFFNINQKAVEHAQMVFNSKKYDLRTDKAPQFQDLGFDRYILNAVDKMKFQLLKETTKTKTKRKNIKNVQLQYKQECGWKLQTKSSKKLLSYRLFTQSINPSLSSEYKKECLKKRTGTDTPASIMRNVKDQNHLKEITLRAENPFQNCIFEKYHQAKKIIKEQQIFQLYCHQIISYMHYIRLYIIFLLKQRVQVQSYSLQEEQEECNKQQNVMVCESLNAKNSLQTKHDDQLSLFRRTSRRDRFECQHRDKKDSVEKLNKNSQNQSIFINQDNQYDQYVQICNCENTQDLLEKILTL